MDISSYGSRSVASPEGWLFDCPRHIEKYAPKGDGYHDFVKDMDICDSTKVDHLACCGRYVWLGTEAGLLGHEAVRNDGGKVDR